jgi:uncharacterized protein YbjT (DUF2867 family)
MTVSLMHKPVAVTGATGFVGRTIVRELVRRGYAVRALVRSERKAQEVLPMDSGTITLVQGDVASTQSLDALMQGAGSVMHLIGIIREVRLPGGQAATFKRLHVDATRDVLAATARAGIKRYIHMSAVNARPDSKAEYSKTKWDAEVLVRRSSTEAGLDWTIFRPGLIHGHEGEFINLARDLAIGDSAPWLVMPYFARFIDHLDEGVIAPRLSLESAKLQPVFVEDVALAFAEALSRPQTIGEIYTLLGSETLNWQKVMEYLRDTLPQTDKRLPAIPVPGEHAAIIATIAKFVGLGSLLPFDAGQAHMATEDQHGDLYKVQSHLGLSPRPFRETVKQYAGLMPQRT